MAKAEKTAEAKKDTKAYKVTCGEFKTKNEAKSALDEAFKKDFRGAALAVIKDCFTVLFGMYDNEAAADEALATVQQAGFKDAKLS